MKIDAYVAGTQTFAQFARESRKDWGRIARYMMRGGRLAADVTEDDVVQELLTGCWIGMQKYDPARQEANRFATFQAIFRAKKRFKNLRRYRLEMVGPHFDICQEFRDPDESGSAWHGFTVEPEQGIELGRKQRLDELLAECTLVIEAHVLTVFYRREDVNATARELYANPNLRRICRFGSEESALRKVRQVLKQAAPSVER